MPRALVLEGSVRCQQGHGGNPCMQAACLFGAHGPLKGIVTPLPSRGWCQQEGRGNQLICWPGTPPGLAQPRPSMRQCLSSRTARVTCPSSRNERAEGQALALRERTADCAGPPSSLHLSPPSRAQLLCCSHTCLLPFCVGLGVWAWPAVPCSSWSLPCARLWAQGCRGLRRAPSSGSRMSKKASWRREELQLQRAGDRPLGEGPRASQAQWGQRGAGHRGAPASAGRAPAAAGVPGLKPWLFLQRPTGCA